MLPLRALWRPGLGLAVWPAGPAAEPGAVLGGLLPLPDAVTGLLAQRRLRHTVDVLGPDGRRRFVPAAVISVPDAADLLELCGRLDTGGELRWYRYLLRGVRRFITAGAVVPAVTAVAGTAADYELRWLPAAGSGWDHWLSVTASALPPALRDGGGLDALNDFGHELLDHEVRRTLGDGPGLEPTGTMLDSLAGPAPLLLPAADGAAAATAWQRWHGSAGPGAATLILRLHQPPDDAPADPLRVRWRLEVCRTLPDGSVAPALPHRLDPHELDALTTELAGAVRAFPELGAADPDRNSLDFLLTTETAEALLGPGAQELANAGVTVLLPAGIAAARPSLSLTAPPVPAGGVRPGIVGLDEITDFEWKLALGDQPGAAPLSDADLAELARQHGGLVRLRGRWLLAEGAALSRAAAFVTAQRALPGGAQSDMAELLSLVTDPADRLPLPISAVHGLGWLDDVAAHGALAPAPVPPPPGLDVVLRPYQQRGLEWLAALGGIGAGGVLADDMGLGKTVQIIALLAHRRAAEPDGPPSLVVSPMSVIGNWQRELARFAPGLRVVVHHGATRDTAVLGEGTDVALTTFATAARDRAELAALTWDAVVIDEAQHVKNSRTAAARALRSLPARHRIALTGTPVENRLEDLRAILDLVNPGLLGSASTFRARFAEPIERDHDPAALARLNRITAPFLLRRIKTDPAIVSDLPDKTELTVRTNLSQEQAGLYQAVLDDLHEAIAESRHSGHRRTTVLAALTRLKQVCNHPAHYLADGSPALRRGRHRSGKYELLLDILTTLIADGERALIFTQYAAFAELLGQWLPAALDTPVPVLHGGRSRTEREEIVARYSADDGAPVLVATLKAGGTGLNLVAANHVIHADRWWNPAVEDQATDRAYRIGQTRDVQVRKFVCVGTLEERIDELIARKRELSALTVGTGETWLSDLGDDELFDLIALRDEAVGE